MQQIVENNAATVNFYSGEMEAIWGCLPEDHFGCCPENRSRVQWEARQEITVAWTRVIAVKVWEVVGFCILSEVYWSEPWKKKHQEKSHFYWIPVLGMKVIQLCFQVSQKWLCFMWINTNLKLFLFPPIRYYELDQY